MNNQEFEKLVEQAVIDSNATWPADAEYCYFGKGCHQIMINREEFNAAADRMRGKPDWEDAPDWAKYLGHDFNGWRWFSHKPTAPSQRHFSCIGLSAKHCDGEIIGDWRNTLEERPEQKALPSIADRYGVEIPWDGRNALPTDVDCNCEVEVTLALGGAKYTETGNANRFNWMLVKSYKVIDERYKPKPAPAPAKPWFEAGELPPVGTECEYLCDEFGNYKACKILAVHGYTAAFCIDGFENTIFTGANSTHKFRPIATERDKFIGAAVNSASAFGVTKVAEIAGALFDAGFRLPDQK